MSCIEENRKEKVILKELKTRVEMFIRYKEIWIDQLRYKKVKLEKMTERGRRIMDNDK